MTTTASAHNVTADLKRALEGDLYGLRARLADANRSTGHLPYRILYADCGMVVCEDQGAFRLADTGDALADARHFAASVAQRAADEWNGNLTHEQSAARCAVSVLTIPQAYERAIEEKEALLAALKAH